MVEIIVHVAAIGAVIGYLEYRLRSYAALMARFDRLEGQHSSALQAATTEQQQVAKVLVESSASNASKVSGRIDEFATKLDEHQAQSLELEKSGLAHIRDSVANSLRIFNESLWNGVNNLAHSISLPSSPVFTCYYCHQTFPVTQRERIGENDYCPDHGSKRKMALHPNIAEVVKRDSGTGVRTANGGSQQPNNEQLPWVG